MTARMRSKRSGFSLIELLIALLVTAIVGTTLVSLLLAQTRFYERQNSRRDARAVARGPFNLMMSELRMVEPGAGIVAASGSSLTLRVPYAFGVHCGDGNVSMLPIDSLMYGEAGMSGYAWRSSSSGAYNYVTAGVSLSAGVPGQCTSVGITTLPGAQVIRLAPWSGPAAGFGIPVLLFRQIRYQFAASVMYPGRVGLWRRLDATGVDEELVAPFDASARFRFYVMDADTTQAAPPMALQTVRGVQLVLSGSSTRTPYGAAAPDQATVTTAVFFKNRMN
jgi:prepilin-type N-terminal cleavage/methylation domain-containing protein